MTNVNSKWIDTQWCRLRPSYFPSTQHLTQITTKEDVLNVQVILGGQLIHLSPEENAKTKSCAQMLVTKNLQKHYPFSNEELWYINFFRSGTVFCFIFDPTKRSDWSKPMLSFYQSIKHRKSVFYCYSPRYLYISRARAVKFPSCFVTV